MPDSQQPKPLELPWLWSLDWMATQHASVPPDVLVRGTIEMKMIPALVINGVAYFSGQQYAQLQPWLLAEAQRELSKANTVPMEPSATQRREAQRGPLELLEDIEQTSDPRRRSDLIFALSMACGYRSDDAAQADRDVMIQT